MLKCNFSNCEHINEKYCGAYPKKIDVDNWNKWRKEHQFYCRRSECKEGKDAIKKKSGYDCTR